MTKTKKICRLTLKCKETKTECKVYLNRTHKLSYSYHTNFYHWPESPELNTPKKIVSNSIRSKRRISMDGLDESSSSEEDEEDDDMKSVSSFGSLQDDFESLLTKTFIEHKQITFIAELEVLKHYDLNHKEIKTKSQWEKHYKVFPINKVPNNELIFPLSPTEMDKIQNTMPAEIRWHINDSSMICQFHKMQSGGYFDSQIFKTIGLQWFLRFFPKGIEIQNDVYDGYCALYLCLYQLPDDTKEIVMNYRLFCNETKTSHTDICIFDEKRWCHGIQNGDMQIIDLLLKGEVTIGCYINIITVKDMDDMITYETSQELLKEMKPYYRYEWHINESMMKDFMQCKVGKKYESNIYENMWCFKCFPNSAGMVQLYIQQCMFPKGIFRNRLKIKLLCPQLQKTWSTVTDFSVNGKTSKPWSTGTLFKAELNHVKSLTFIAEIIIIEQVSISGWTPICQPEPRKSIEGNFRNVYFQNKSENKLLDHIIISTGLADRYVEIYDDKQCNDNMILSPCKLIKAYYPLSLWEWDIIDKNLLNQFIVSKNMEKYESNLFEMGGFVWYLKAYPNGYNRENRGNFQVFVTMASLPKFVDSVLTNIRLSCPQTSTSYTFFAEYKSKRKTWGWHRNLSVMELHSLFLLNQCNRLTFQCEIKILKVVYKQFIIYEYKLLTPINKRDILSNCFEYEWQINESMMEIFRKSSYGKMYESAIFDQMFCLQIYPNELGNVQLFIQSCAFPEGVSAILVKLELFCVHNGSKWQHIVKFSVAKNNWGWTDGTLSTDELYNYNTMTFKAKIQFIELYDNDGMEIICKLNTHQQEIEDMEHEEKTVHVHDDSYHHLELQTADIVKGFLSKIDKNFDEQARATLIENKEGYIRIFQKEIDNENIFDLITKFSMTDSNELFSWNKVVKFEMNIGRFMSDVFEFYHNLKWVLEGIPVTEGMIVTNRYKYENEFYNVMLSLCSMPSVLYQIVLCCRIYCNETMTSSTSVCVLFDEHNIKNEQDAVAVYAKQKNLSSEHLLMKNDGNETELKRFNCAINILRVKDNNQDLLYDHGRDDAIGDTLKFEWKIDQKIIQRFFYSYKGQTFESEDVFYDLWCIGIAPKGAEDTGLEDQVIVYLQLCSIPNGVSALLIRCRMKCIELGIETKYAQECMDLNGYKFSQRINYALCSYGRFTKKIKHNLIKELTIECEVTIVRTQLEADCEDRVMTKPHLNKVNTITSRSSEDLNVI